MEQSRAAQRLVLFTGSFATGNFNPDIYPGIPAGLSVSQIQFIMAGHHFTFFSEFFWILYDLCSITVFHLKTHPGIPERGLSVRKNWAGRSLHSILRIDFKSEELEVTYERIF
jgi:hypothetical protein